MNRDEAAQKIYGHPYAHLSAWAQRQVDRVANPQEPVRLENPTMHDVNTAANEASKEARIRVLEDENQELWDENEELRTQLEVAKTEARIATENAARRS